MLNADFRRTNSDADNTWSQAADTEIEFCLAIVDPDGNATNGIRRQSTNKPSWQANDAMKGSQGLTPWDPSSYLNIWVCNLSGGLLGYAQFPGGPASTDGVVCDYAYFGTATFPFDEGCTCTHEVGHYLNLRHIWGDGGCSVDCGGPDCAPCSTGTCDVPAGTNAVNIRRKRADLTWDAVSSAVSYTVQFRVAGTADWTNEATTAETSIAASSLNNNVTYEWRVRSNCNGDASAFSPICSFTAGDSNSSSCAGERVALAEVRAYPNPGDASVRIEVLLGGDAPVSLQVADAFGRLVMERELVDGAFVDLDVSDLDAGIYLVRATNGLTEDVIRLVVE